MHRAFQRKGWTVSAIDWIALCIGLAVPFHISLIGTMQGSEVRMIALIPVLWIPQKHKICELELEPSTCCSDFGC